MTARLWPRWYGPMERAPIGDIVQLAARLSGLTPADILGRSRVKSVIRVRQAVYRVAIESGHGFSMTGRRMAGRDHTTVMHGYHNAAEIAARDPAYATFLSDLRLAARIFRPIPAAPKVRTIAVRPVREIKPVAAPVCEDEDIDDMEALSRAVAAYYERQAA